jgi:multicomponent K+:H+ antiporter subunit D
LSGRWITTALYYIVHSTLCGAALFLIVDLIAERRGRILDRLVPAAEIANPNLLGGLFLLGAMAIVGLPPLSGFIGKLMILQASRGTESAPWIWSIVLGMTLVMVLGFARAGSTVFWNVEPDMPAEAMPRRRLPLAIAGLLIAATAALAAFGGPVTLALQRTAEQTLDTRAYVRAVLGPTALPPQAAAVQGR